MKVEEEMVVGVTLEVSQDTVLMEVVIEVDMVIKCRKLVGFKKDWTN